MDLYEALQSLCKANGVSLKESNNSTPYDTAVISVLDEITDVCTLIGDTVEEDDYPDSIDLVINDFKDIFPQGKDKKDIIKELLHEKPYKNYVGTPNNPLYPEEYFWRDYNTLEDAILNFNEDFSDISLEAEMKYDCSFDAMEHIAHIAEKWAEWFKVESQNIRHHDGTKDEENMVSEFLLTIHDKLEHIAYSIQELLKYNVNIDSAISGEVLTKIGLAVSKIESSSDYNIIKDEKLSDTITVKALFDMWHDMESAYKRGELYYGLKEELNHFVNLVKSATEERCSGNAEQDWTDVVGMYNFKPTKRYYEILSKCSKETQKYFRNIIEGINDYIEND